jgi:hypothetical protein
MRDSGSSGGFASKGIPPTNVSPTQLSLQMTDDRIEITSYIKAHQIGTTLIYTREDFIKLVSPFLSSMNGLNSAWRSVSDKKKLLSFNKMDEANLTDEQKQLRQILLMCYYNTDSSVWDYIYDFFKGKHVSKLKKLDISSDILTKFNETHTKGGKSRRRRSHKKTTKKSKTRKTRHY